MPLEKSKFEEELEKEQGAAKLAQEIQRGGYDIVTTEELKKMIDDGKDILVIDTMPYEDSYKKNTSPAPNNSCFRFRTCSPGQRNRQAKPLRITRPCWGLTPRKPLVITAVLSNARSHNGAVWAKKLGYKNVIRYSGGILLEGAKYR